MKKYIEIGPQFSLVITQADYENNETYKILDKMIELMAQRKGIALNPFLIWYHGVNNLKDFVFLPEFSTVCFKDVKDPFSLV